MFLDVLGSNASVHMNIKLAKIVGINTAIYFAELSNVLMEVFRKKKFDENGFFKLNRKYMEERTTLTEEDQYECDTILKSLSVLAAKEDDPDMVAVDLQRAAMILIDDNLDCPEFKAAKKKIKVSKSEAAAKKKAGIILSMKTKTDEYEVSDTLHNALHDWVDATYANKRYLTFSAIDLFVNKVISFSQNEAVQIEVINCAIANGWADAEWAINSYVRNKKAAPTTAKTLDVEQKASVGFDKNSEF